MVLISSDVLLPLSLHLALLSMMLHPMHVIRGRKSGFFLGDCCKHCSVLSWQ